MLRRLRTRDTRAGLTPLTSHKESRPELSASVLQAFLLARAGTGVRPTGRRCSSGRHFRSICPLLLPWGRRSGLGDPGSSPGGATHSSTHSTTTPCKGIRGSSCFPTPRVQRPLAGAGDPAERDARRHARRQRAHGVVLSLLEGRARARRSVCDGTAATARAAPLFSLLQSRAVALRPGLSCPSRL